LAYIDTIQNYVNPRIVYCLGLNTGVAELEQLNAAVSVFPNPSAGEFTVDLREVTEKPSYIRIMDINGRLVHNIEVSEAAAYSFRGLSLANGLYAVKIGFKAGEVTKKLVVN